MKKLILTSLAAAALTLTGCDSKNDSPATETFGESVATLLVPSGSTDNASAQMVQYTVENNYSTGRAQLGINGLEYDGTQYRFLGYDIPFNYTDYYNGRLETMNVAAIPDANGGSAATSVSATIATMLNFRPSELVQPLPVKRQYSISFNVGNIFTARTFDSQGTYFGQTMTTYVYNEQHKEFSTDKPIYAVDMDLEAGTANVTIYNPVFAAEMPPSMASTMLLLEGLKITYTHDAFRITGTDIVPKVREGALMTPNPAFTFNSFLLQSNASDLRGAQISFKVAGRYDGMAGVTTDFNRNNQ